MVQERDRLVPQPWGVVARQIATDLETVKKAYGPRAIGAVIGAQATNEEAFALKRLMRDSVGSDRLAMLSFTPLGMSGDDNFLIRANKNPNTRGLQALALPADQIAILAKAVADGELKMLIVMRVDLVRVMGEAEFVKAFGALEYMTIIDTDANETVLMANHACAADRDLSRDQRQLHQLQGTRAAHHAGVPAARQCAYGTRGNRASRPGNRWERTRYRCGGDF